MKIKINNETEYAICIDYNISPGCIELTLSEYGTKENTKKIFKDDIYTLTYRLIENEEEIEKRIYKKLIKDLENRYNDLNKI